MFEVVALCISLVVFVCYFIIISYFHKGWNQIQIPSLPNASTAKLSCVVALRNEEKNVSSLMESLKSQNYSVDYYEVILVDDHSTDNTFNVLSTFINELPNFRLVSNQGEGKKKAIATGISQSKYNYIVCTDADCIHPQNWLLSMGGFIERENPDMIVGPVKIEEENGYFNLFQRIDFLSLILSGAGAIGVNKPIMCNGANLAFSKQLYVNAEKSLKEEYASGDDIFLLQYAVRNNVKIKFLKCKETIVNTRPVDSLSRFFHQRVRWASKSKGYTDIFTLQVAWSVFLINFLVLLMPYFSIYFPVLASVIMVLFLIKVGIDTRFLKNGSIFFNFQLTILDIIKVQLLYPIYISITVIYAIFGGYQWKSRKLIA